MSDLLPGTLIERTFRERIVLVGVIFPGLTNELVDEELDELAQLVDSAGADVVGRVVQRRDAPDPATFVGRGKAEEIAELSRRLDADTVVFDDELTPAQHRNLEKVFGRTAIDRTAVILDIFAQNARSPEGKAQVELALLRYRLPRLRGRGSSLSQQAGGIGTRGPGETQLEVDRRRLVRRMHRLEADLREVERTRTLQRRSRARGRHRELALVGYTNAGKSTLLNQLTHAGVPAENRLFVTLDPRTRQLSLPGGETVLVTDTVGFVRKLPHELVEAFRSTLDSVRFADLVLHVADATAVHAETQRAAVHEVLTRDRGRRRPRARGGQQGGSRAGVGQGLGPRQRGCGGGLRPDGRGHGRTPAGRRRPAAGHRPRRRVGRAVGPGRRSGGDPPRGRGGGPARRRRSGHGPGRAGRRGTGPLRRIRDSPVTFHLPPYPYDRLAGLAKLADAHPGGMVDCSIGTPCDPPLRAVVDALATSGTERGYPASAGSPQLRAAAAAWLARRFGLPEPPPALAACVGTKEFVASVPHLLRLREPERDTVLYPAVSYPTYAMGAELAGCRAVAVDHAPGRVGGIDLAAIDPADAARALLLWSNSPSNPSGGLGDLAAEAAWARSHGVPLFSDECYAEFTWDGPPRSVLQHGPDGVVAVHSLSKRSNLAGVRVGFFAGDAELVEFLRAVRQHAGLMVPGPAQAAGVAALRDDEHVEAQRARYSERLHYLAGVLETYGCPVSLPEGGFYLWVPVPERWPDAWAMAEALATDGGLLGSPGDLYGAAGGGHVRVAVVQPMERLTLVGERLASRSA